VKQSLPHDRVLTPTRLQAPAAGWRLAPRISHADELQLACRLAECQRELLALALHVPQSRAELQHIHAELESGALRIGDVLEQPEGVTDEARQQFDAWVKKAGSPSDGLELRALRISSAVRARLVQAAQARPQTGTHAARSEPPLSPHLTQRMRRLDLEIERIRDRFTSANQGLVSHVVQRYIGMGLSRDDLVQEGNIGLMRAIDKFDHRRGNRFGAYAIWWIRQSVRRALANQSRTIRIPVHALGTRYTLDQAARRLALALGRQPSEQELAEDTGVIPASVAQVLAIVKEPLSLDAPRSFDSDDRLVDSVADPGAPDAAIQTLNKERAEHLRGLLVSLSVREQQILRMRFGLDGSEECTLEQIGQAFALTRERVRQIVVAALAKLHRQTQVHHLELSLGAE
jgi:RNA polymerase primary sigma factor